MTLVSRLRRNVKAARKRGAPWVRALDVVRLLPTSEGRAALWTRIAHGDEVHQTTPYTREERYPELFDRAAQLLPDALRILSFGCSTGEELVSLRRRFPYARITGAEINARSRRIAARRVMPDARMHVVPPRKIEGTFDLVFALAVLQREPHKVSETELQDLTAIYPFARFDAALASLVERLNPGGLLCVMHAHYRVEDSSSAAALEPVAGSLAEQSPVFGRDGRRLADGATHTMFRKRG
jgi:trans-aconitate methyltransferase